MKKTTFESFLYSFVFSLFAIFVADKMFFYTPDKAVSDLKIPEKNIVLFLKDSALQPQRLASTPTKKIVLSTVADIPAPRPNASIETPETPDVSPTNLALLDETPLAPQTLPEEPALTDDGDNVLIPLERKELSKVPPLEISPTEETPAPLVLAETSPLPEVRTDDKQHDEKQNDGNDPLLNKKVVQLSPKTSTPIAVENSLVPTASNLSEPDKKEQSVKMAARAETKPAQKDAPKEISLSESAAKIVTAQANEPMMLIPLESNNRQQLAAAEIKSAAQARRNQVALNAKDTPIASMKSDKVSDEQKNSAVNQEKVWESMKEKQKQFSDDDPWVVAKGNKYPNNQMLLDDKKYKISDEEVQKMFNTQTSSADASDENIQLASKTVDNLLIPIPEDILNDENLTPQLISSPKNQEIKEELEARGLIRKEEEKEEKEKTADEKEKTSETASDKESGILDSLTSLFSGNKDNTPEVGVNEDQDEEENSLFSAFSRKRSRLISKILPTEIRLSFQPNRAEISGQTLKWIKAFAQKTAEEPSVGLEIRIDGTSSPLLQRRRLNLLQNILLNEGAAPEKISTVFTAREPNSFILRTVRINKEMINMPAQNNNRYMQW